ncbi:dihydrolipoyl dehydrogenase [Falsigemmobacter faecalis]|uniref:Dihydrolipoyl dehydrogenase n=1 Tax=Falsigemmobacter faecalis TaxID=2488730 RepID=A0A3P3DZL6_9RHOB|nr:dihydrolipoyl dehydrogenase [Falsigemmobacter faecalis]RRH78268.1 dihydrolipoyl dehydrogenase [Falsigemmobacter faecalis]
MSEHDLIVIGGGPGGYTAAFRAADLGRSVTLIEAEDRLGGVCLNRGCIPSKTLLSVAERIESAAAAAGAGVRFGPPQIDLGALRAHKDGVVTRLTTGLAGLAKRRKINVVQGMARFTSPHELEVTAPGAPPARMRFQQAIIATGSEPIRLGHLPQDPRIMDSTGALALADVPERLLIIGGGIIGLEMAQVYHALGAKVVIAEAGPQLIPGADPALLAPLTERLQQGTEVHLSTLVSAVRAEADGLWVTAGAQDPGRFDRILVAIGRRPRGAEVAPEAAGIALTERGFIPTTPDKRTAQPHIFAIGDVTEGPMLAHKAVHEAKVAAEVACGEKVEFAPRAIPSVAYTHPEVAWTGLTETEAKARNIAVKVAAFPWAASGRALSAGAGPGTSRLILDPATGRILGAGLSGQNAGELIAVAGLAIEMGATAGDLALTIHAHPTLSETLAFAAESYLGTLTDL